jgi:large subunit ribosomal protein L3
MAAKGILGRKLGMTQIWDAEHRVVPVTVIEAGPCRVVQLKTPERDGYAAVQLAYGATKQSRLTKPEQGHLAKSGAEPSRDLAELRVDDLAGYEVGQVIAADVFDAGDRVDVTGISKGKGFTGVMQRHNFKGQGASHGNHKKHRAPGAIGACATPARVFKGVRMAGQSGSKKVTTLNLEVVEGDPERGLLLIKGSVPGANGSLVLVRNAVKGPEAGPYEPRAKTDSIERESDAERTAADGVSPSAESDAVEQVSPDAATEAVEASDSEEAVPA